MNAALAKLHKRIRGRIARIIHPNSPWERFYAVKNPWQFDRPGEIYRFEETNRIIREHIGPVGSLLEIGAAEGHQTQWLLRVADRVHGVDISATALKRAKHALAHNPRAAFSAGALPDSNLDFEPFDLVAVLETIYYAAPEELPAAFETIERLGKKHLMSVYLPFYKDAIAQLISTRRNVSTETITWEGQPMWLVAWW
jgi:2-polyprenyl-3-methyl-5-hydroxy-6-metoxy-1,4-benzoquinol methylase